MGHSERYVATARAKTVLKTLPAIAAATACSMAQFVKRLPV